MPDEILLDFLSAARPASLEAASVFLKFGLFGSRLSLVGSLRLLGV